MFAKKINTPPPVVLEHYCSFAILYHFVFFFDCVNPFVLMSHARFNCYTVKSKMLAIAFVNIQIFEF